MVIKLIVFGLLVGVLSSGTGLGGGFMVVPMLLFMGYESKQAVGTSFFYIFLVAISSLAAYFRLGTIDYKTGALLACGGIIGAQLGPMILQAVPEVMFKRAFGVMMVATGIWLCYQTRS